MLQISQIRAATTEADIDNILDSSVLDIASPFISGWALNKLEHRHHDRIRIITRLPQDYSVAPTFIENDPCPLKRAMDRFSSNLSVFALPSIHAKLYLTSEVAWVGSANFTHNGFSGKEELILEITSPSKELKNVFEEYRSHATRITIDNINFLIECIKSGITIFKPERQPTRESPEIPISETTSYKDFSDWLSGRGQSAEYLRERISSKYLMTPEKISNKYRMSGHIYSGYHGVLAFLLKNKAMARRLLKNKSANNQEILDHLADFIKRHGNKYGGPRGGTWNSKLSVRLGGTQSGGGAGDVVVKHLLSEIPHYMQDRKLL